MTALRGIVAARSTGRQAGPRQLMAYLGIVPADLSSGAGIRPRGITKAGNSALRALHYEAAWCYRTPAKVASYMYSRMPKGPTQRERRIE